MSSILKYKWHPFPSIIMERKQRKIKNQTAKEKNAEERI
jgi:hypothetical protein